MNAPRFAVVGHPNKGKSSIVATLAYDASVAVSPLPGTTTRCHHYPMRVDGETLYTLIDTPGFQRARGALDWLRAHDTGAAGRGDVVRSFVAQFAGRPDFPDECELLAPIVGGAGIIYVTDGSLPYGREYEAEMEILRWTGQPSLALINPIGGEDHIEEWRAALSQYFRIVRVFSAWEADFGKRVDVLHAFAQLHEDWRAPLERAAHALVAQQQLREQQSALVMADALYDMLIRREVLALSPGQDAQQHHEPLRNRLFDALRRREAAARREVERIYQYDALERGEKALVFDDVDLFSAQSWDIWGLSRRQLAATGAASGALAGATVDLALHGTSLLAGAALGSVVGGVSAWFGFNKLADVKVLGTPLGDQQLTIGPMRSLNFPFVVLGRAMFHHHVVASRTHAERAPLAIEELRSASRGRELPDPARRALAKCFTRISRGRLQARHEAVTILAPLIQPLLG